jgi:hypothetical protein
MLPRTSNSLLDSKNSQIWFKDKPGISLDLGDIIEDLETGGFSDPENGGSDELDKEGSLEGDDE